MKAKDAERLARMIAYPIEVNGEPYTNREQAAVMLTLMFGLMGNIHECELKGRVWTISSAGNRAVVDGDVYFRITDIYGKTTSDTLPITLVLRKVGNRWMISDNAV